MTQNIRQYIEKNDVQIDQVQSNHAKFLKIKTYQLRFRTFAGEWSHLLTRELLEKNSAVGALLYDPLLKKVVLLEQFRLGALKDEKSPWQIEIIAGLIDTDEAEIDVVKRECQEESGLNVKELKPICRYWVSPGCSNEHLSLYAGIVDANQAQGFHGLMEEGEDIKVLVVDYDTAFQWIKTGLINNAATIIALQWLQIQENVQKYCINLGNVFKSAQLTQ